MIKLPERLAVYVHFPFCVRKCPYCDFVSYDSSGVAHEKYIEAVLNEFRHFINLTGSSPSVSSIYLGGGTPSLMNPKLVEKIFDGVQKIANIERNAEITIEMNPATAGFDEMSAWRAAGVNRISLGIQSTLPKALKKLGRIHSAGDNRRAFDNARKIGFDTLSVDLIYGIPSQTAADWVEDLSRVIEWKPDHVSAYILKPPKTWKQPSENALVEMYLAAGDALAGAGFIQYEVSNYAKPGKESRHNMTYWTKGDYIGLGCAAHSHIIFPADDRIICDEKTWRLNYFERDNNGSGNSPACDYFLNATAIRWWNIDSPEEYINRIGENGTAANGAELIDPKQDMTERIMLGLRIRDGFDLSNLDLKHREAVGTMAESLFDRGLAIPDPVRMKLTSKGMLLADEIALKIIGLLDNG